ncbi:hypothetical protein [Bacillus cereus]|uniref:hypothetical protein n=1 Tax=Bacillus cereus TaxID=1396 RepID=UPI002ABED295|nr:hypothetical protein [Bacillus cereus]MDZ4579778.1 hypothetical protein [Bacillus cereus]
MVKLYFPTTSLNFNDMFATESISPKIFYSKRIFGTKRHFSTELAFNDAYIFLFKRIPYFQLIDKRNSEFEEYPIILELEIDTKKYPLKKINDEIYAINRTIYFSLENISRVIFISSEDMQKVIHKSKLVIESKSVAKYAKSFDVLSFNTELKVVEKPLNLNFPICNITTELELDRIFNNIKGLFYSYYYKRNLSPDENVKILRDIAFGLNDILVKSEKLKGEPEVINDILLLAKNQIKKQYSKYKKVNAHFGVEEFFEFSYEGLIKFKENVLSEVSEKLLFENIISYLIKNPKKRVGYLEKDEINTLTSNIINLVDLRGNVNKEYFDDLEIIYNRFTLNNYEMDIKHIKSIVFQNFYAFLLKYNNLDELNQYIKDKSLKNEFILYSFIGSFVGYSGLDREFTENLFNSKDETLFRTIDDYLDEIRNKIRNSLDMFNNQENKSAQITLFNEVNLDSSNDRYIESRMKNNKNCSNDLYKEIQKIKQGKSIRYFLRMGHIILEDGTKVYFKKKEKNVVINLNNKQNVFEILLTHKDNADTRELVNYKQELKLIGVNQVSTRGNYPIAKIYKLNIGEKITVSPEEEKLILNWLNLINSSQKK